MLDLNEALDQLAMANSVSWYCHVLKRRDSFEKDAGLCEMSNEYRRTSEDLLYVGVHERWSRVEDALRR